MILFCTSIVVSWYRKFRVQFHARLGEHALRNVREISALTGALVNNGSVPAIVNFLNSFMDVISIEKTGENFRLVYDTKGRFAVHRITAEEAEYKLGKVKRVQVGRGGVPYLVTHDART